MDKAKIFSFRSVAESLDMAWLPIIFVIIALLLILLNPISAYRHGIIRRRLDTQIASPAALRNSND